MKAQLRKRKKVKGKKIKTEAARIATEILNTEMNKILNETKND